jgi:hypothetical protein
MPVFLDRFAGTLARDGHAVMVLNGAGWPWVEALRVPPDATLAPHPHRAPQADPMERVWLFLRERFPSLRLRDGCNATACARCPAWNAIADAADRVRSLCLYPSIKKIIR